MEPTRNKDLGDHLSNPNQEPSESRSSQTDQSKITKDEQIKDARKQAASRSIAAVIAEIKDNQPELIEHCRVVGVWLWIEFDSKPDADVLEFLKDAGFYWNRNRKAWQHHGGYYRPRHPKVDPRLKYGVKRIKISDNEIENQAAA